MLKYDSGARITSNMCLQHEFFKGAPKPVANQQSQIKLKQKNITHTSNKLGNVGSMVIGSQGE